MKDGFKSATIIATLNLLSWKKDYRIWSVGTVIMVLIIRYLIALCIAKWKDFDGTFAPGAVSRCNEQ